MNEPVEWIQTDSQVLAIIIRAELLPKKTTFITPNTFTQQAGFVVYPAGGVIAAHTHKPIPRSITGTPETLLVKQGKLEAHFYTEEHLLVTSRMLYAGDLVLLVSGGHGFHVEEDVILLEIKQGPYTGLDEKERFE